MGKCIYIVPQKVDSVELLEFIEVLSAVNRKNTLDGFFPQLKFGREIAIHLDDVLVNLDSQESYILNGRFEANVQSVAEQIGNNYKVVHGIQPVPDADGIIHLIKNYAVVRKLERK